MVRLKQITGERKLDETKQEKILKTKRDRYESKVSKKSVVRKKRRNLVLEEIKYYQLAGENLILKKPFQRLVKEILAYVRVDENRPLYRMTCAAIRILQEVTESFITDLMNDGVVCALHANRITVLPRDFDLVLRLSPNY